MQEGHAEEGHHTKEAHKYSDHVTAEAHAVHAAPVGSSARVMGKYTRPVEFESLGGIHFRRLYFQRVVPRDDDEMNFKH